MKKALGQNFLRNRGAAERIIEAIAPEPGELIVEIGPGDGALTRSIAAMGNEWLAIELDRELIAPLRAQFGEEHIIEGDALEVPLPERLFRAVGNLPYNAGTPILRRVIASPHLRRAVFMLQKEVADRIVAKPRTEQYGFLTLFVQLYAKARVLLTLDPKSFYPPPKVRSSVIVLDPDRKPFADEKLIDLISVSFRMRRKKLVNNLTTTFSREQATAAIAAAGLGENVRAEEMSLEEFSRLAKALEKR